jgi:hypothetical protein
MRARGTDRFEDLVAWLLTSCAVGVVLLAVVVGRAGHDHTLARSAAENAARTPTRATLMEDVDGAVVADSARPRTVLARWTAPDAHEAEGRVVVGARHQIGDTVPVWVDHGGRLVPAPVSPSSADVVGWTWGVAVALGGWAVLALLWSAVRAWTGYRNATAWAREWAIVEPTWSGRVP